MDFYGVSVIDRPIEPGRHAQPEGRFIRGRPRAWRTLTKCPGKPAAYDSPKVVALWCRRRAVSTTGSIEFQTTETNPSAFSEANNVIPEPKLPNRKAARRGNSSVI
jgi:hypothetical protein